MCCESGSITPFWWEPGRPERGVTVTFTAEILGNLGRPRRLGQEGRGIFRSLSSHNMDIASQSLEIVITLFGAKVSSAENVLNLPWHQQFFELSWQTVAPMWDVQVS